MYNIITKIYRIPSKSGPCLQRVSRSYCYKPVERKYNGLTKQSILRKRRKTPLQEYEVNANIGRIRPAIDGGRSLKVIETLPPNASEFNRDMLIGTFDKLSVAPISDDALLHENFSTLIDATKLILPKMTVAQIVHIFTQICRAEISMFDELTEIIVNALLRRVTFMTLDEIIDADYSLRNYYGKEMKVSKLFETLRQAMRTAFVVKVNNELIESQNCKRLMRIVRYLSNNQSLVKSVDTKSLSEQLLLEEDREFQLNDVVCILISVARYPKLDEHSRQLVTKMFRIWCCSTDDIQDVVEILELLATKKSEENDLVPFQDPLFISHCSQLTIDKNDLRCGFDVLSRFNDLNFANPELIDFLSIVFNSEQFKRLKVDDYATFCTACKKANYKPTNFQSNFVPAIEQVRLQDSNFHKQLDLALTLDSLGIHHENFIQYLLKSAEIQVLYKDDVRLEEINKANSIYRKDEVAQTESNSNLNPYLTWLMTDLEKFVGINKVARNVAVSKELTIPLVMKVNTKTGHFMDMKDDPVKKNLFCRENELIIGILTQDVGLAKEDFQSMAEVINNQRKLIKQRGWIAITLDESLYGSMQTYKRAFTFFKIILYAINNRKQS